jgi:long-chain acyl-CoA synthetase
MSATILNLTTLIETHARRRPDRMAIVHKDLRLTYAQVDAMASQVAHGLKALGVQPGDKVALSCPNLPYFPIAFFGILKLGAVVVPLNVLFKPREIAYHLKDSDAVAYLCFEGVPELPMGAMGKAGFDETPGCKHFIVMTIDPAAPSPIEGVTTLGRLMHGQPPKAESHPTKPDDTAIILYTSGTTGQPKGAELTHSNIALNAIVTNNLGSSFFNWSPDAVNVMLITLPLFHSTGLVAQLCNALYGGFTVVLLPRFEPPAVLETMQREKVNFWTGVPTMYWSLLQYAKANTIDTRPIAEHLRFGTSGGAPMPVQVMQEFTETFGVRILEGYGLSETSPVASFNHVDRPSKPGTVGQPLMGVEIRCVADADTPVPAGQPGEVVIRGHNIMKGYYKRPDATAEALRNGWFHTGDIGQFDDEGYLSIIDRKKDMILRGGFNVYPRELEEVLMTHPAVSMVAVIGVPHERLGEEVKAVIVRRPGAVITEEEMLGWCKEQFAGYKAPRLIEFRDALPVGATGKILKRELRG